MSCHNDSGNPPLFAWWTTDSARALVTIPSPCDSPLAKYFLPDAGRMPFDVFISYSVHDKLTAQAVCATLEANGVKLDMPYTKRPDLGLAIAFITDPWGTRIELNEPLTQTSELR